MSIIFNIERWKDGSGLSGQTLDNEAIMLDLPL